jgi:hypothetical protein
LAAIQLVFPSLPALWFFLEKRGLLWIPAAMPIVLDRRYKTHSNIHHWSVPPDHVIGMFEKT